MLDPIEVVWQAGRTAVNLSVERDVHGDHTFVDIQVHGDEMVVLCGCGARLILRDLHGSPPKQVF